jgi:hypothetical protein
MGRPNMLTLRFCSSWPPRVSLWHVLSGNAESPTCKHGHYSKHFSLKHIRENRMLSQTALRSGYHTANMVTQIPSGQFESCDAFWESNPGPREGTNRACEKDCRSYDLQPVKGKEWILCSRGTRGNAESLKKQISSSPPFLK